jgi:predicted DCC family thiol-disulfide oxidoreductase YuxK
MLFDRQSHSYRTDPAVPDFDDQGPVCVMDAHCALCARGARWIAGNDHREEFRIIPLQSALGIALMNHYALDPTDPTSWLYLEDGQAFASLDAFMRVGRRLGGIWKAVIVLRILPPVLRDALYSLVARNRYRWFGRTDMCSLSDPELKKRIIS